MRICPKCKKTYADIPALSRVDNKTLICPECGTREALEVYGLPYEVIEQILEEQKEMMKNEEFYKKTIEEI